MQIEGAEGALFVSGEKLLVRFLITKLKQLKSHTRT